MGSQIKELRRALAPPKKWRVWHYVVLRKTEIPATPPEIVDDGTVLSENATQVHAKLIRILTQRKLITDVDVDEDLIVVQIRPFTPDNDYVEN